MTQRGFTLVELLVVVAILGILSSIVLVSLTTANTRGKDGAVQANLVSLRDQAQLYYNENGGYSTNSNNNSSVISITGTNNGGCVTGAAGTVFGDARILLQTAAADLANGGGSITCNVDIGGAGYVVYARLPSESSKYFCVDSNGVGAKTTHTPTSADTSCVVTP